MSRTSWLGLLLWIIAVSIQSAALVFAFLTMAENSSESRDLMLRVWTYMPGLFAFLTVGLIVVLRRPDNSVGWILMTFGLAPPLGLLADAYIRYVLIVQHGSLVFFVLWVSPVAFLFSISLMGLILLLFPSGRLLSSRWRLVVAFLFGLNVLTLCAVILKPGAINPQYSLITNPLGIGSATAIVNFTLDVTIFATTLFVAFSAVAVVLRFQRGTLIERAQLKWFAYATLFLTVQLPLATFPIVPFILTDLVFAITLVAFPLSIGIAILRYRLFDIDLIIRRTLIYSIITAMLALFYSGSVIILQQIFRALTGAGDDLAIIISTLAIAALFNPLRHRVQNTIDHRFYRRKYNAQQVLARFATTVRDEVELEKLSGELLNVVNETIQPASVSLWLKSIDNRKLRANE